jgi:hypothetical protein
MGISLLLFDRLAQGTAYRGNVTQHLPNWQRTTRSEGGYWMGDGTITPDTMGRSEMTDLYNSSIGRRLVETTYGIVTWEGEIVDMTLALDGKRYNRTLNTEKWHNRIKVRYGGSETAWSEDTDSSDIYGESGFIESSTFDYDSTGAVAARDRRLTKGAFPRSREEGGLSSQVSNQEPSSLHIQCAGYVFSMNRRYYEANLAPVDLDVQIATLVAASEFVASGRLEENTTDLAVFAAEYPGRIWDLILHLIQAGDTSGNDWTGGVYADRLFNYEQAETAVTHYWRGGRLLDLGGVPVPPSMITPNIIVQLSNSPAAITPPGGATIDNPKNVLISEVQFRAPNQFTLIPEAEPLPQLLGTLGLTNDMRRIGRFDDRAAWARALSAFLALDGLRGFWPMSAFDSAGVAQDLSGNVLHLTNVDTSVFNVATRAPYCEFDGAADYLTHADDGDLDITGTETYVNSDVQGLTMGGWFYIDAFDAAVTPYMGKWQVANQLSYLLAAVGAGSHSFRVTTDGFTQVTSTSPVTRAAATWTFLVGRFTPSAELSIFYNASEQTEVAGIPASIHSGTSRFSIGEEAADGVFLDGRASLCFICASSLSDETILSLYNQTRSLFSA